MGKCGELSVLLSDKAKKMHFLGKIEARMDAKGRLFFPAEFRRQMGDAELRFVVRRDIHQPCLVIYPAESWHSQVEELRSHLNLWDASQAMLFRQFLADVFECTLDANGRFIVPKRYHELCGSDRRVVFLGLDDRIELWAAQCAEKPFVSTEEFGMAVQTVMTSPQQ